MKSVKACVNTECVAQQKRAVYNANDEFCTKCGSRLQYVCAVCRKQLPDGSQRYCERCQAQRKDGRERAVSVIKKSGSIVIGVAAAITVPVIELLKRFSKK